LRPLWLAIGLLLTAASALAQDSRVESIAELQAEKAARLAPYAPNRAELILSQVQNALTMAPNGFYPYFDSVYSGGGFTLGAGYRRYLGDRLNWNVQGLYSVKNYKLIELALHSPRPQSGRLDFRVVTGWRDATQVSYYGLGIESPDSRSAFGMQQGYAGGDLSFRPLRWTILTGGATYEAFALGDGSGSAPDIDDTFTGVTAPGLGDSPDFLHTMAAAAIDTRASPGYARRGGLYEIAYHRYDDRGDLYSFDRFDAEIVQHMPIVRENWVLSLRGRLQSTLSDTDAVPYFLMPALGSGSTLRSYGSWRFRDRHALLFSGEWRWTPNRLAMDAVIFYDVGTVADRRDGLRLDDMKSSIGGGLRFHTPVATPLRVEIAGGGEGLKLVFGASAAF
jgi:hypothetical protein